jgi:hypothetical protein
MCDEALWLHVGRVMAHGPADEIARRYIANAESHESNQSKLATIEQP